MFGIPWLPTWNALHPLIVHFPIALLMIAPLFIVAAIVLPRNRARNAAFMGLVLVALGTGTLFVAVATGDATAEAVEQVAKAAGAESILHQHEELAERTELLFGVITILFSGLLFGPRLFRREVTLRGFRTGASVLLVIYVGCLLSLVSTAHAGGRLVHEFGVTASGNQNRPLANNSVPRSNGMEH